MTQRRVPQSSMQRRPSGEYRAMPRQYGGRSGQYAARPAPPRREPPVQARMRSGGRMAWFKWQLAKRPLPIWIVVVADILVFAIALLTFALFHHVLPKQTQAVGITSNRGGAAVQSEGNNAAVVVPTAPANSVAPEGAAVAPVATELAPAATEAPTEPVGYFGTKFADKFTDGEVIQNGWSYQSANLNVSITPMECDSTDVYVCDIYVKDISSFATAFAQGTYGRNYSEQLENMAQRSNAIVSINGDYYGNRDDGAVIRNGMLYREDEYTDCDMCVLYWDGTMKTFPYGIFDARAEIEAGAYQSWTFGPALLDDSGMPKTSFNTGVAPPNPRTAIGYYEPGHYCFVVVDGRNQKSEGMEMSVLSYFMYNLGCKVAYNLDGGKTTQMLWGTSEVNEPVSGGRKCSDLVLIREPQ